jgi:hypothetical protein
MRFYNTLKRFSLMSIVAGLLSLPSCSETSVYDEEDINPTDDDTTDDDDTIGDDDTIEDRLIESEEDGVNLIADILEDLGYEVQLTEGTYEICLQPWLPNIYPDIIFTGYTDGFSYFEFHSEEDPAEVSEESTSCFPFYKLIKPDYESDIIEEVYELLETCTGE